MTTFDKVYEAVRRIPKGSVATYGQIAEAIGNRRLSRVVGYALHVNPEPGVIPCHRVVKRDGEVSSAFAFGGANRQVELLRAEGVTFADESHVDMARCCVRAIPLVL
ncbi:MAG: MGMT family protein [Oscillospiraceae bacterium]|jgi:methylated-DNA-protein-cysteine methyltransferase-like protein|nr:MGMT family protein [Oscillospiraceae bacterium]MBQ1603542.1 MGMT family protein [Oscillospiraceae bacterium]MBQ1620288.1 MGMT family protein [Oscillospiraceae bacterium]MBQ1743184.1 MGMT family protein [Oscillospiraceae bacterium]MBQ1834633.1 MGMT family protein [Oscillospiraceae bacterium]